MLNLYFLVITNVQWLTVLTVPQLLQSWTEVTENYEDVNGIN